MWFANRCVFLSLTFLLVLFPVDAADPCASLCKCSPANEVECSNLNVNELSNVLNDLTAVSNGNLVKLSVRQCNGQLEELPPFPENLRVRSLEIASCGLKFINETIFDSLGNDLVELRLMNNSLTAVPYLGKLKNLQTLNLNRNELETVGEKSFDGLNDLVQLRLKKNKICSLPQSAFDELKNRLELLDLSLNCFGAVPARVLRNFKLLKHLDLSSNSIDTLPDLQFMNLPELKEIRLSNNQIGNISSRSFVNVPALSHLYLRNNQLGAIDPSFLQNFKQLELIDVSRNRIQKIPTFKELSMLKSVNFDQNEITRIDTLTFSNNPKLISINLGKNKISLIARNSFDGLVALNNLKLQENQLTTIDAGVFDGMPKLQILILRNNTISELSNLSFASLPELTLIDLANNQIQTIPSGTFTTQKRLYWLDLSDNKITGLERGAFAAPVANILLDGNQLICDSSIDWFITYLVTNSIRTFMPNQSEVICTGPEQYANVRLKDLMIKKANETLTSSMQRIGMANNEQQRNNFLASLLPALSGMGAGGSNTAGNAPLLGALAQAVPSLRNIPGGWGGMIPAPVAGSEAGSKGFESAVEQFAEPLVRFSTGAQPAASDVSSLIKSIPNLIVNLPGYGNIDLSKVNPKLIEHVLKGGSIPGVPKESMDSVLKQIMQRVYAAAAHAQGQPIDPEVASNLPTNGIDYKKYLRPLSSLPDSFVTNVMQGEPLPFLTPSQTEVVKGYYTQSIPIAELASGDEPLNFTNLAIPGAMRMLKLLPPGYNISRIPPDVIQAAMRGEVPDLTRLPSDLQNYIKDNWEKTFNTFGNAPDVSVEELLKKLPKFDTVELTTFSTYDINTVERNPVDKQDGSVENMRLYVAIALGLVSAITMAILIGFCVYIRKLRVQSTIYDAK
ncbi:Leucine Rich repeat-containing domain protein [Aphelenchoides besseyi]|nr:Leucine Rich repeat-containing domain protein [Aphelenchoides besseyi]KAI6207810.1 Leucine Rich repeat-containing domain protein [Aphelenchoides besseyi]